MSIKCGSLDISQPYGPPQPVTGITLPSSLTTEQGYHSYLSKEQNFIYDLKIPPKMKTS
jgi:hypothetical protein